MTKFDKLMVTIARENPWLKVKLTKKQKKAL